MLFFLHTETPTVSRRHDSDVIEKFCIGRQGYTPIKVFFTVHKPSSQQNFLQFTKSMRHFRRSWFIKFRTIRSPPDPTFSMKRMQIRQRQSTVLRRTILETSAAECDNVHNTMIKVFSPLESYRYRYRISDWKRFLKDSAKGSGSVTTRCGYESGRIWITGTGMFGSGSATKLRIRWLY